MKDFVFSHRSLTNFRGVHPDLIIVAIKALQYSKIDFVVTSGARTVEEQKQNIAKGVSWTMNSRHIPEIQASGLACAIDIAAWVDGKITWQWGFYEDVAAAFRKAAHELGIPIIWGGSWRDKMDGTHFELDRQYYP